MNVFQLRKRFHSSQTCLLTTQVYRSGLGMTSIFSALCACVCVCVHVRERGSGVGIRSQGRYKKMW